MDKRILLIGGAGFLGTNLANTFRKQDVEVGILDRLEPSDVQSGVAMFTGDLRDSHLLRSALSRYPRVIYLAHEAHSAPASERLPSNFLGNIELFLTVLQEARECRISEFTLLSSGGAVYGNPDHLPIPENHPKNPRSPYGIAKLTMEKYLAMAASQDGFRHLSIRPSNPYGPGQNIRSAQGLVAVAMAKIARGETITIRGDGSAIKDYLFIDDFADACLRLLTTQSTIHHPSSKIQNHPSFPSTASATHNAPETHRSDHPSCTREQSAHSNILKNVGLSDDLLGSIAMPSKHADLSGPFNIGSGQGTTVLELVAAISKVIGKDPIFDFQPAVAGDVQSNVLDCRKFRDATGWVPSVTLEEGLLRTWDWMKPHIFRRATD